MLITSLQILFYALSPVGIYLLVKTIGMLKKMLNGHIIVEMPLTHHQVVFTIPKQGTYAIWQQGKLFKRTITGIFDLKLTRESPGTEIALSTSLFSPHVNSFEAGRIEWKRFDAAIGNYKLEVIKLTDRPLAERLLARIAPVSAIDYSQYSLQVRQSLPAYHMVISIPLIMVSLGLIFGGPVLAINAADVAKAFGLL